MSEMIDVGGEEKTRAVGDWETEKKKKTVFTSGVGTQEKVNEFLFPLFLFVPSQSQNGNSSKHFYQLAW